MKTTIEIPDDLFRRAKARAALEGIPLRDLVAYGLQLAMDEPTGELRKQPSRAKFPLIKVQASRNPLTDEQVAAALRVMEDEDTSHDASFV